MTEVERTKASARATLARLVAALFAEPDEALADRLGDPETLRSISDAAHALGLDPRPWDTVCRRPPALEAMRADYRNVFGHTVRSVCPPYELEYDRRDVFQQSHALADIVGFYEAFGLAPAERAERPDHFVAQMEFLAVCAWKEAHAASLLPEASEAEVEEAGRTCRAAQRDFLADHAARWMPALFARLRKHGADGHPGRAAALAERLLAEWCGALGVSLGPDWLELRPTDEEDLHIECGVGQGPGQVEMGPGLAAALGDGT